MTALPPVSDLVQTGISKGTFKGALSSLRVHLAELLGVTGNQRDALIALGAPLNSRTDKLGAYTVAATDRGKVVLCSGTFTLSITDAAALGDGFVFAVLNNGSGTITIDPHLSQLIDGATTKTLSAGKLLLVYGDGVKFTSVGGLDSATIVAALGFTPGDAGANANFDWQSMGSVSPGTDVSVPLLANYGVGLYRLINSKGGRAIVLADSLGGTAALQDTLVDTFWHMGNTFSYSGTTSRTVTIYKLRKLA